MKNSVLFCKVCRIGLVCLVGVVVSVLSVLILVLKLFLVSGLRLVWVRGCLVVYVEVWGIVVR